MNEEGTGAVSSSKKTGVDEVHKIVDSSIKVAAPDTIDAVGQTLGPLRQAPLASANHKITQVRAVVVVA